MAGIQYQEVPNQLRFGQSVFPQAVSNDGSVVTLEHCEAWIKRNQAELEHALAVSGVLLFRGFPVDSAETFDRFASAFNYPSFTYQASLSNAVRINYTERVFSANEAPKDVEIYLHNEMAQTPVYPSKLFFFCKAKADAGGATPLCRSDRLYAALSKENPNLAQDFLEKGVKYSTAMPANDDPHSGQGRSWRSTLSVADKGAAEAKLRELGYSWEWPADGGLKAVTPVLPAVLTLKNGVRVFFNQLIAAYLGWKGVRENPSRAVTFGDGSAISKTDLDSIVELAGRYTFDMAWEDGDVAIVDNYLAMHGRRPYSGERKRQVLVALAAA